MCSKRIPFLLAVSLFLLPACPVGAELLSHYTFDGNLEDSGPGGNHGTFVGGDPVYVEGHDGTPNGAISFDGVDDYVDLAHTNGLPIYSHPAFSITLWVKGPVQKDRRIFDESSTTNNSPLFNLGTDNRGQRGVFDLFIRGDNGQAVANHRKSTGIPGDTVHQGIAFDDTWHHIAYIDDNGQVTVYIDGVKDPANFSYTRIPLTANKTILGAIVRASACCFFKGALDDVRIYTHALTEDEVLDLLDPGDCPAEGDTSVTLTIDSVHDMLPGRYTARATAVDQSGDTHLHFFFKAEEAGGTVFEVGPVASDTGEASVPFILFGGSWTITCRVDDDPICRDRSPEDTATVQLEVDGTPRLICHLPFDGDIADHGDAANPTEFLGGDAPTFTTGYDGTENGAVLFDGVDDLIRIEQQAGLPIYLASKAYSVCMWVKGDPQRDMRVFSEGSTQTNTPLVNIGTHFSGETGKVTIYMRGDITYRGTSDREAFDGDWHHIAWIDDGGKAVLYIDGIRDATDFTYQHPNLTLDTTTIGGILRAAASHFFTGAIDDVRIYNYALSEEEVLALVPEPGDCPRDDREADTRCDGLTVEGPEGGIEGTYTLTAVGLDDSGDDPLWYTFVVQNETGTRYQAGPQTEPTASFNLSVGQWTAEVKVDDDLACRDDGPDAVCTVQFRVLSEPPIMISHFPFDGDLNDTEPAANNGTLVGYEDAGDGTFERFEADPVFSQGVDCTEPGALRLGGEDEKLLVEVTQNAFLPLTSREAFSFAAWVRGTPQPDKRVFSESSSTSDRPLYNLGTDNTGTTPALDIYIRGDDGAALVNHAKSTGAVFDGTWHHIVWVDDNGNAVLYIDGQRDPTDFSYQRGNLTVDTTTFGGILRKGRLPGRHPGCCYFEGEIDDVRLFNYALSPEEVAALYADGPSHCCPDEGDTHCDGIVIEGSGEPGTYRVIATARDDSGDSILYLFRADNGEGTVLEVGPQENHIAEFTLTPGTWTITVVVDDDPLCSDEAPDSTCSETVEVQEPGVRFKRGDANADGTVDIADAVCILAYLFGDKNDPCKSSVAACYDAADANDDEALDIADAVSVLGYLFGGSGPLPAPGTECGRDPEGEDLQCSSYAPCE